MEMREIDDWLKLDPDQILFQSKARLVDVKRHKFNARQITDLVIGSKNLVTIIKHTLEGNVGIQVYYEKGQIKIDKL